MMIPLGQRVFIEPDKETESEVGGLIVIKKTTHFKSGLISEIGDDVNMEKHKHLKKGVRAFFSPKSGAKISPDTNTLIMNADEIVFLEI